MKYLIIVHLFVVVFHISEANIKCTLKTGVSESYNKVGEAALKGIKYHAGRSRGNMNLFECTCDSDDDSFDDNYISDIEREFDNVKWNEAEIFRIHGCTYLRLRLDDGRSTLADYFDQKLLIIEDIKELDLITFNVGSFPGTSSYGTFSSIYFRDVTFVEALPVMTFEDKHEIVFERVKIGANIKNVVFKVDHINNTINNVFRMEESEFPGIDDITSSAIDDDIFSLEVLNKQKEMDGSREKCNYDYKGSIILRRNTFGLLTYENIFVKGAENFHFVENSVDIVNGLAFRIRNAKNIHINGNHFGYPIKGSNMLFYYEEYRRSDCDTDELDLPENKVGHVQIKYNRFNRGVSNFFELDKDPNYSEDFYANKFKVEGNEMSKRCNCTNADLPSDPTVNEKMAKDFVDTSRCLSYQSPPLFGNRTDICKGEEPKTSEELRIETASIASNWTVYLIVAIFVTMLLTAIATFAIMYFFCSGDKNRSRTVSPAP